MGLQVRDYNSMDGLSLFVLMLNEKTSLEEKRNIIENFADRLDLMDEDVFLKLISKMRENDILEFSNYIDDKVKSLGNLQLEKTLYTDKYYHSISALADYLLKQEWFIADGKSSVFQCAYRLEQLRKEENVDISELQKIGKDILEQVIGEEHDFELSDMIIMNYMELLEKFLPEGINDFTKSGYRIIDRWVGQNLEITPNMLIFLCQALKKRLKLEYFAKFFEFSNEPNEDYLAYFHVDKVKVNLAYVKKCYDLHKDKKLVFQYLFFVLGHELDHASILEYKTLLKREDLKMELKVHNACVSESL